MRTEVAELLVFHIHEQSVSRRPPNLMTPSESTKAQQACRGHASVDQSRLPLLPRLNLARVPEDLTASAYQLCNWLNKILISSAIGNKRGVLCHNYDG